MNQCFKCGISGDKAFLMDAVSSKGIVKICRKCSFDEELPLVKRPSPMQLKEPEKRQTVYERLSKAAGIESEKLPPKKTELKKQETTLRDIVDSRFKRQIHEKKYYKELIDNFHWVLMRARRLKKLTAEQVAQKINESPYALKMAEKGVLGENYLQLIKKLEDFLGVRLIKREFVSREEKPIEVIDSNLLGKPEKIFENNLSKKLTIFDLRKIKTKHEGNIIDSDADSSASRFEDEDEFSFDEDVRENEDKPEFVKSGSSKKGDSGKKSNSKDDMSQDEIDKILFRR